MHLRVSRMLGGTGNRAGDGGLVQEQCWRERQRRGPWRERDFSVSATRRRLCAACGRTRDLLLGAGTGKPDRIVCAGDDCIGRERDEKRSAGGFARRDCAGLPVCAVGEDRAGAGVAGRGCKSDRRGARLALSVRGPDRTRLYCLRIALLLGRKLTLAGVSRLRSSRANRGGRTQRRSAWPVGVYLYWRCLFSR